MRHRTITLTVVVLLVASVLAGTGAGAVVAAGQSPLALAAQENETRSETGTNFTVTAGTGAQLSTVIASASDDVQTEFDDSSFEAEFHAGNDSERAEAIANRAAELDARALALREAYENVTRAYENGTISRDEYAQRVATLTARARNVRNSSERLERFSDDVPRVELRAAGLNGSELNATIETLEAVSGPGQNALLAKFTGQSAVEIEVRSVDGVRIEVESEDGERSREIRRSGDASTEITIEQSVALANARTNLSTSAGSWALSEATVHEEDGEYRFEFLLANGSERGEAEVRVDGSSGAVVRVEEELERPESDEAAEDGDDENGFSLVVVDGTVAPNDTVTVQVRSGNEPVANVPVTLEGEPVGETDENGTLRVTLPDADDARIEADDGAREGRLDLEFEDETENETDSQDDGTATDLSADSKYADGTITTNVTNGGEPVEGATVDLDGERVGKTDASGTLSFDVDPDAEDYEIEISVGDGEVESTYVLRNGSLVDAEQANDDSETGAGTENETASETGSETQTATPTPSADDVDIDATLDDGTVTLTLTNDGSPIEGAMLSVNGDSAGDTDADGVVSFQAEADEEDYDVRFEKDDAEIRTEYLVENGTIEQTEAIRVD